MIHNGLVVYGFKPSELKLDTNLPKLSEAKVDEIADLYGIPIDLPQETTNDSAEDVVVDHPTQELAKLVSRLDMFKTKNDNGCFDKIIAETEAKIKELQARHEWA